MKTISIVKACDLIHTSKGKIFGVTFTKRTTGKKRNMAARVNVWKGVNGKGMRYDPRIRGLLPVWDMNKGRRQVNLDTLERLKIHGVEYRVTHLKAPSIVIFKVNL